MAERFERYREEVVRRFYEEHFSRFDRQIVLVDLLGALNAGPGHFADTQETLALILKSFRYGSTRPARPAVRARASTGCCSRSARPTTWRPTSTPALKQLLELMITAGRARRPRYEGITTEVMTLASLRCTDVVRTEHHGQVLSCVRGHLKDEDRETVLFPGEIPPDLPEPDDWASGRFRFKEFAPRRLHASAAGQHIRLDQALAVPDRGQAGMSHRTAPALRPFELDPPAGATVVEEVPAEARPRPRPSRRPRRPPPAAASGRAGPAGCWACSRWASIGAGRRPGGGLCHAACSSTDPLLGVAVRGLPGHGAVLGHGLRRRRDRRHAPPVAPRRDPRRPPTGSPPRSCTARPSRCSATLARPVRRPAGCSARRRAASPPSATTP